MNDLPLSATDAAFLRLPDSQTLFANRAARLRWLAEQHRSLTGYLSLMAELAEGQQFALEHFPPTSPARDEPGLAIGKPSSAISVPRRDPVWREALRQIVDRVGRREEPLVGILAKISNADPDALEDWADRLLNADCANLHPGLAPFLAAALQVYWTVRPARVRDRTTDGNRCPLCGAHPVASIIAADGKGLRYLCCSLCSAQWNRVRIVCVNCGGSERVHYYGLEDAGNEVKAEACGDCKTYLKIFNQEKAPALDPYADDLASLPLDILMGEAGFRRFGFNPWLLPSE